MGSVNKAIIVGNLGADPDVRTTQSGQIVATLSIATSESWNDNDGNRQEKTEWHRVVVWGKQAESCQRFLSKGRKVYVEGKLQTRKWQDKESGQDRYSTEIVARNVTFLDSAKDSQQGGGGQGQQQQQGQGGGWGGQQQQQGQGGGWGGQQQQQGQGGGQGGWGGGQGQGGQQGGGW